MILKFLLIVLSSLLVNVCMLPAELASVNIGTNSALDQTNTLLVAGKDLASNLLTPPVKTRETARQEIEGFPSAVLSLYDNSQKKISELFSDQVRPIIDTISEKDKYGNSGQMFDSLNKAIINGYEAFANFMNRLIKKPEDAIRSFGKKLNVKLDTIGGRIVGLA